MRHTKSDQMFYGAAEGRGVVHLAFRIRAVFAFILLNIKLFCCGSGETGIGHLIPLHGGTGTGTLIAAFNRSQPFHITHTDLITIVNKRCARHGKEERKGNLHFFRLQPSCHSIHIMITGRNTDQSFSICLFIVTLIGFNKLSGTAKSPS